MRRTSFALDPTCTPPPLPASFTARLAFHTPGGLCGAAHELGRAFVFPLACQVLGCVDESGLGAPAPAAERMDIKVATGTRQRRATLVDGSCAEEGKR